MNNIVSTGWRWVGIAKKEIVTKDLGDMMSSDTWIYASGILRKIPEGLWAIDEPNDVDGSESCGVVGNYKNGLNDYSCSGKLGFICQFYD